MLLIDSIIVGTVCHPIFDKEGFLGLIEREFFFLSIYRKATMSLRFFSCTATLKYASCQQ